MLEKKGIMMIKEMWNIFLRKYQPKPRIIRYLRKYMSKKEQDKPKTWPQIIQSTAKDFEKFVTSKFRGT